MTVCYSVCNTHAEQKDITTNVTTEEHSQTLELNYIGWNICDCEETESSNSIIVIFY